MSELGRLVGLIAEKNPPFSVRAAGYKRLVEFAARSGLINPEAEVPLEREAIPRLTPRPGKAVMIAISHRMRPQCMRCGSLLMEHGRCIRCGSRKAALVDVHGRTAKRKEEKS